MGNRENKGSIKLPTLIVKLHLRPNRKNKQPNTPSEQLS